MSQQFENYLLSQLWELLLPFNNGVDIGHVNELYVIEYGVHMPFIRSEDCLVRLFNEHSDHFQLWRSGDKYLVALNQQRQIQCQLQHTDLIVDKDRTGSTQLGEFYLPNRVIDPAKIRKKTLSKEVGLTDLVIQRKKRIQLPADFGEYFNDN